MSRAFRINDSGQIVGYGINPDGGQRCFLLTLVKTTPPVLVALPQIAVALAGLVRLPRWGL